jgi:LacI family transcriptional regulator
MVKRATIKDIASLAGVSLGSVHYALLGKGGVSEQTRLHILDIAKQINYLPNSSAASLKRKQIRIAAAFPGSDEDNRVYYSGIWEGIRDAFDTVRDLNIVCIEVPYYNGINNHADELTDLIDHEEVQGLLSVGYTDTRGKLSIRRFIDQNIPVVLVTNDLPLSGRLCCVQPDYFITGRMLAEFITGRISQNSNILIWAGDVLIPSHYLIVEGFENWLKEQGLHNPVYKIHSAKGGENDLKRLLRVLDREKPAACCCVNALGSVFLGRALEETGLAGRTVAVGSDLCDENFRFLRDGVFTTLIQKNPYMQAYTAAKCLIEFLLRETRPPMDVLYVNSEIVFKSNASMYQNGANRLPL